MWSFNGVPGDNDVKGWWLSSKTSPFPGLTWRTPSLEIPGRDGVVPVTATLAERTWKVVFRTTVGRLTDLTSVFTSGSVLVSGTSTRVVSCTVLSISDSDVFNAANRADTPAEVTVMLRLDDVAWRDPVASTSDAVTLGASTTVDVLPGVSMPVRDAVVRVKGQCSGLRLTDTRGGWVQYGSDVPAGSWWRFEAATGRAFVTTTDVWAGGTEVTGSTDWSSVAYPFSIFPAWTDPATRVGRFVVSTSARSGAQVQVQGRGAHVFA